MELTIILTHEIDLGTQPKYYQPDNRLKSALLSFESEAKIYMYTSDSIYNMDDMAQCFDCDHLQYHNSKGTKNYMFRTV